MEFHTTTSEDFGIMFFGLLFALIPFIISFLTINFVTEKIFNSVKPNFTADKDHFIIYSAIWTLVTFGLNFILLKPLSTFTTFGIITASWFSFIYAPLTLTLFQFVMWVYSNNKATKILTIEKLGFKSKFINFIILGLIVSILHITWTILLQRVFMSNYSLISFFDITNILLILTTTIFIFTRNIAKPENI